MKKLLLLVVLAFGLGGCVSPVSKPALHLPAKGATSFTTPDGRTWNVRFARTSPNGDFWLMFTPEPPSEKKWTESFSFGFKSSGMSLDEMLKKMEEVEQFEKGVEFSTNKVRDGDFVIRCTLPEHGSRSVQRWTTSARGAWIVSYEDRRMAKGKVSLEDWDRVLASTTLDLADSATH